MDDPRFDDPALDAALQTQDPLAPDIARRLLARGQAKLDAGEAALATVDFRRAIGHEDAGITGAALLGYGDALYRLDDEAQAKSAWDAVTQLRDNPSTYRAWRNLAGVRVREGDLQGAIAAYREADLRAPSADKQEIAARLGWLAKETGNSGAANRYFEKSRGSAGFGIAQVLVILTAAISFIAFSTPDLQGSLLLSADGLRHGELWRLLTVTLVHGGYLHLALNMYALWIIGPIVEGIWGRGLFALFYLLTAIGGSTGSFLFSDLNSVGASGAIFGLVGVIIAGTMTHNPALDRRARGIIPQLGMFVIINLAFGFFGNLGGLNIDNAAHVGGLLAGLWLGFVVPPGKAPTLRGAMQHPRGRAEERSPLLIAAGVILLVGVLAAALAAGGATI
jgi:membrane associated rhomboid family serine protease